MNLSLPAVLLLAQNCAPNVAPETLISVAQVESHLDPLTIGVNGKTPKALHPFTKAEAVRRAQALIASGANVDLGVGQINSRNLGWLSLSIEDAFDPCRNLQAATRVLVANYKSAPAALDQQAALRVAFSLYNTGDRGRGFRNGYVQKVSTAAQYVVPAIAVARTQAAPSPATEPSTAEPVLLTQADPEPATWDVFARTRTSPVMVFRAPTHSKPQRSSKPNPKPSGAHP